MGKDKSSSSKTYKSSKEAKSYSLDSSPFNIIQLKNGVANNEVQCKKKRTPKKHPGLPAPHVLAGAFGVCRSGKTNAVVNAIQAYHDYGCFNLLYCISPTYDSNFVLHTLPFVDERKKPDKNSLLEEDDNDDRPGFVGIFKDASKCEEALESILNHIKTKKEEWDEEEEYKKAYKMYKDKQNHYKIEIRYWDLLSRNHYRKPKDLPWPSPAIFIDDMTHTKLMANTPNNKLIHLSLHFRHIYGVGVSIFQAFQTFKGGMPKALRTNISLILIFGTCNLQEIEEMYKEVSNNITFETFKRMLFEATKEPHSFLMIDKNSDDPCRQFSINFDRFFEIDVVHERRKLLTQILDFDKVDKCEYDNTQYIQEDDLK